MDGEYSAAHFKQRSTQASKIAGKKREMDLDREFGRENIQMDSVKDSGSYLFYSAACVYDANVMDGPQHTWSVLEMAITLSMLNTGIFILLEQHVHSKEVHLYRIFH